MSESVALLDGLETDLQAAQADSEAREVDLAGLLVKTSAHWKTWEAHWQTVLQLLEERSRVLAAKSGAASAIVTMAESNLDETEVALRDWLATAQVVAQEMGRS